MSEVALTPETISRFRRNYIEAFGAPSRDDALYAAVSEGRRFAGMEHWLPFFYERLDTLFDYLPDAPFVFDHLAREALAERHKLILDHYEARKQARRDGGHAQGRGALQAGAAGPALVSPDEVGARMPDHAAIEFTPFDAPDAGGAAHPACRRAAPAAASSEERADPVGQRLRRRRQAHRATFAPDGRKVVIAGWTAGSLDRLAQILAEHQSRATASRSTTLADVEKLKPGQAGARRAADRSRLRDRRASSSSPSRTFSATGWCAARRSASRASDFIAELASLAAGDIVVTCRSRHRPLRRPEDHRGGRRAA